jgi:hypothetical protein
MNVHGSTGVRSMTRFQRTIPILACTLLTGAAAAAGEADRGPDACTSAVVVDTAWWGRIDTGVFTMRLPRGYRKIRAQGIDSDVDGWRASHGRKVGSDYGWTEYVGDGSDSDPNLVCERGPGGAWMIVAYEQNAAYGIAYYARDPSADNRSLVLRAESPRRQDMPELLAIIHSVRWSEKAAPPADEDGR